MIDDIILIFFTLILQQKDTSKSPNNRNKPNENARNQYTKKVQQPATKARNEQVTKQSDANKVCLFRIKA